MLTVSDNGVGFDFDEWKKQEFSSDHMGMTGIYERASLFGGKVVIKSSKGDGFRIKIKIPYKGIKND
jgi:signal transduction histidine kinase